MIERWAPVPGYEGYYEVSDLGRVRSISRVVEGRWGPTQRGEKLLAAHPAGGRYLKVSLCRDGSLAQKQVHTLVLEAFVGPAPERHQCDHIDFDIGNNALENLRWVPIYSNITRRRNSCLTEETAKQLRSERFAGVSCVILANKYGISERHVYQVVSRARWKDAA